MPDRAGHVDEVGLSLTGTHVTALSCSGRHLDREGPGRRGAAGSTPTTRTWLCGAGGRWASDVAGRFGQLGLRDVRLVTGAARRPGRALRHQRRAGLLRHGAHHAVGAGPDDARAHAPLGRVLPSARTGPARSATTPRTSSATAASGWSRPAPGVTSTGRRPSGGSDPGADHRRPAGREPTCSTPSPSRCRSTACASVGVWDPHLARTDDGWLVGFVSARKYFHFHPATGT